MYDLKNIRVDIETELQAMASYLATRWDDVPDILALFTAVAAVSMRDARFWFDDYAIKTHIREREKNRRLLLQAFSEEGGSLLPYYEDVSVLFNEMGFTISRLKDAGRDIEGRWDYSRKTNAAYRAMVAKYPTLTKARPKGWAALAENYCDFDGQEEYANNTQHSDEDAFQGANSSGMGGGGFTIRTALPYVMYDDMCQGRKAPYTLVSAVYAHFLSIAEQHNTQAMLEALAALPLRDEEPTPVFDLQVTATLPLLKALIDVSLAEKAKRNAESDEPGQPAEAAYQAALESTREFQRKPEKERDEICAANKLDISALLKSLMSTSEDPAETAKRDKELEFCRSCLIAASQE